MLGGLDGGDVPARTYIPVSISAFRGKQQKENAPPPMMTASYGPDSDAIPRLACQRAASLSLRAAFCKQVSEHGTCEFFKVRNGPTRCEALCTVNIVWWVGGCGEEKRATEEGEGALSRPERTGYPGGCTVAGNGNRRSSASSFQGQSPLFLEPPVA